ncbi:MAG: hypothetical protein AB7O26_07675 [Planctomycetaceae bacterium]
MERKDLNRRDFARYTAAAFGGMIAGSSIGCGEAKKEAAPKTNPAAPPAAPAGQASAPTPPGKKNNKRNGEDRKARLLELAKKKADQGKTEYLIVSVNNVCRGLNACSHHKGGANECAGQGDCATVKHDCSGKNECKGQGGCGENPGLNDCKGKGGCHMPLMEGAWTKARATFEKVMKEENAPVGPAPEAKK